MENPMNTSYNVEEKWLMLQDLAVAMEMVYNYGTNMERKIKDGICAAFISRK